MRVDPDERVRTGIRYAGLEEKRRNGGSGSRRQELVPLLLTPLMSSRLSVRERIVKSQEIPSGGRGGGDRAGDGRVQAVNGKIRLRISSNLPEIWNR